MVGSTVPYIHSPYGSLHPSIPPPLTLHRLRRAVPAEVKGEEGVWGSEEWVKDIKSCMFLGYLVYLKSLLYKVLLGNITSVLNLISP